MYANVSIIKLNSSVFGGSEFTQQKHQCFNSERKDLDYFQYIKWVIILMKSNKRIMSEVIP